MTKLRRNDVVLVDSMYGRVISRIDDTHVRVIDCGKYDQVLADADLEASDYNGTWAWGVDFEGSLRNRFPVYNYMPTLRKIKQIASGYNDVWKKSKKTKPKRLYYYYPDDALDAEYDRGRWATRDEKYKTRFYHNWSHIEDCLTKLDAWPNRGKRSKSLLKHALIWHDFVYDPESKTNEQDSADRYRYYFSHQQSKRFVNEVCRLILLTKGHTTLPNDVRGSIMISIDLSILGSEPDTYAEYVKNIRKEYSMFTDKQYNVGRIKVLQKFLDSERIYPNDRAAELWEVQARINIQNEIDQLA
jgi:predicted metal-dependent HD superfamily phosphohydrolase